jgi:hypothetical protein
VRKRPKSKVIALDPLGLGQGAPAIRIRIVQRPVSRSHSKGPASTENAIGSGPNDGIDGTTWRAVNLGTRPQ